MSHWPLLSIVTFLPILGVALILILRGDDAATARNARWIALWTSLVTMLVSFVLWADFDTRSFDFQFVEQAVWLPASRSPITWGSTASRCSSCCCRPS